MLVLTSKLCLCRNAVVTLPLVQKEVKKNKEEIAIGDVSKLQALFPKQCFYLGYML